MSLPAFRDFNTGASRLKKQDHPALFVTKTKQQQNKEANKQTKPPHLSGRNT